jgi:hypothetical protein
MAIGKVVAHFCLTLIIKELKISVEHDRVVTTLKYRQTLNVIFSVVGTYEPHPTIFHLHLGEFVLLVTRIW